MINPERIYFKAIKIRYFYLVLLSFCLAGAICAVVYLQGSHSASLGGQNVQALSGVIIGKTILIDPGHGGFDPGAIGVSGVKEKDINLAVAQRLIHYLKQAGATVLTTRSQDTALGSSKKADMAARVQLAQINQASLFISIQANSIPQHQYRGAQVFYHKDSAQGKALAEAIQSKLTQNLQNTTRLAMPIQNIYVTRSLAIPCVVAEVGFLSNPGEEALLQDPGYQDLVAYSIFLGIIAYYSPGSSF